MAKIIKSHLLLLLKCQGVDRIEDLQTISLSNSNYLITTKVLANRLRVIGQLVGPFQSAFILGRLLIDNAVVAREIIASWQRKRN